MDFYTEPNIIKNSEMNMQEYATLPFFLSLLKL